MVKTYLYKIFYIHFFLSIQLWVKAQSTAPATTISTASRNSLLKDTALIIHQLQTVAVISTKQPDSAMLLANQALESSKALGFKTGIAGSLLQIGILYQDKSDFLTSIQLLQSALPYCGQNTEGNIKKTSLLYFIGDAYWYNNKPDSAALYYYSALEHINSSGVTDAKVLVETYSKLILLWVNLNDNFMPTLQAPDEYTASAVSYFNKSVQQQGQTDALRLQVLLNQGHIKRMEKNMILPGCITGNTCN